MTYPFVYKPISIDGKLLFDGGIYNNFPVNVMRDEFKPDYIIGSNVSNPPQKPDESDLIQQIMNMVMTKVDYSIAKEEGLLLDFNLDKYPGFDFSKVDELYRIGYDSTMKYIEQIKSRITRRVPENELNERRKAFRNRFPELKFQKVTIDGIDNAKKWYIEQFFHNKNDEFTLEEFKSAYFKLFSDKKILEVVPHAVYNEKNKNYDLHLKVKMSDHIKIMLGGNISSSISNQTYIGVNYQNMNEFAQSAWADAQFGKIYNGLGLVHALKHLPAMTVHEIGSCAAQI
jgi:NTE family protein